VKANTNEAITMRVSDVNGRIVETRKGIISGQAFKIGHAYTQGAYFVEFLQGGQRKIVKMIKL